MDTHIHHEGGIRADQVHSEPDLPTRLWAQNDELANNALGVRLPIIDEAATVLWSLTSMHSPTHGENDRGTYTICGYDKTEWPCRTACILDGTEWPPEPS